MTFGILDEYWDAMFDERVTWEASNKHTKE